MTDAQHIADAYEIAVIDPDREVARALGCALEATGYTARPVAIDAPLHGPEPDAVLVDVSVPLPMREELARTWRSARVIYISSGPDSASGDVLVKPFSISELDAVLSRRSS